MLLGMSKPNIETDKLMNYIDINRAYSIERSGDEVVVRFSPNAPEQLSHAPDGDPVEHLMYGKENNGRIYFYSFVTRSGLGETKTELDGEDDPVMLWLQYI